MSSEWCQNKNCPSKKNSNQIRGSKNNKWYQCNNRELPWRNTISAYHIWISEIILQQTRVNQGLPYYLDFIKAFPTIERLALATEDEVLKLWQGLGYYSRARNLHYTAKDIVINYNGKFPDKYNDLLNLKGIGEYTAAAISSDAISTAKILTKFSKSNNIVVMIFLNRWK